MAYITVAELRAYLDTASSTTFTADAGTDILTLDSVRVRNSLKAEQAVVLSTTNTLPDPLAEDTKYYVIEAADQGVQVATTSALAAAGTEVDLTDAGLGTHTITKAINDESLLSDAIDAAEAEIERITNSTFEAATLTKYYDRSHLDHNDSSILWLGDDLLTVTTLTNGDVDGTEIAAASYWLLDRNDGPPYHAIQLTNTSGVIWTWDTDGWVSVAGTWGRTATVDATIKEACKILSAYYYRLKDAQTFDVTAVPEAGVMSIPVGIPKAVSQILVDWTRGF